MKKKTGGNTMSRRTRFTPEQMAQALKIVRESGKSIRQVAEELGMPAGSLGRWISQEQKELVAWLAYEPDSDEPRSVCPVLTAYITKWSDSMPDDATRARLLGPYLPRLVGTRSTPDVETARAWLAVDWLVRVCAPAFLELSAGSSEHAEILSALPPVLSASAAIEAQPKIDAARAAAAAWGTKWGVAEDVAWYAAWYATGTRVAAWAAAWAGTRDAERDDTTWDAERTAAREAASEATLYAAINAAINAARAAATGDAAAWVAARDALHTVDDRMQVSAQDLLSRMIDAGSTETAPTPNRRQVRRQVLARFRRSPASASERERARGADAS